MEIKAIIEQGVRVIREKTDFTPEIGMILGSGLGDYANQIEHPIIIPYCELPGFPISTVSGHEGQFVMGLHKGKRVIAMQGRIHYYEGYPQTLITVPIRIMKKLGVEKMVLTNAAGGVNQEFEPGTLMILSDHINHSGSNPLMGENLEEFGVRFPDMSSIYPTAYRERLKEAAVRNQIQLKEGVYMMLSGPCYETPAEVRMVRMLGADAVGMSTVPEGIVCAHCGIPVIGISCITNMAAGILNQVLDHKEVMETANRVKADFIKVLDLILEEVF